MIENANAVARARILAREKAAAKFVIEKFAAVPKEAVAILTLATPFGIGKLAVRGKYVVHEAAYAVTTGKLVLKALMNATTVLQISVRTLQPIKIAAEPLCKLYRF
jgi:hypothetical protein